ncbi:hypothetical protein F5X99DRAFT_367801 [Biscogniauxia marginata]|nr:hypothetical protein F5X99DRAFT_367801 [Biscogniauxia marginata]
MLPSRGLPKANPASALRYSLSSRLQPARSSPSATRNFSQARSPSRVLNRGILRSVQTQYGAQLPHPASIGIGASLGVASSVFAQRAGASRNLSLWPFQSKQQEKPPSEAEPVPNTNTSSAEPSTPVLESRASEVPAESNASVAEPGLADPVSTPPSPPNEAFGDFDLPSVLDIPEQIGYLKSLGLDFGYGPTACCEWLMEHIYIYTGMPWWATIATVGILYRAVMFKPTLTGSKHQILLQKARSSPEFIKAKAAFDEAARRSDNQAAMLQARATISKITKESGAQWWRPLVGFLTIPFSYGMFRLFRAMAALPVPSLETGGVAWFTNLTVHDPYFILPSLSIGLTLLMMKQTQRANLQTNSMQESMQRIMIYIFPPLIFLGTAWLPAGLQWFFLTLSAGSIVQTSATLSPAVRRWAGLPPLPSRGEPAVMVGGAKASWQPPTPRGLLDGIKKDMSNASSGLRDTLGTTEEKARWQKAQEYEERRANEDKEKAYRRMDDLRRKRAERAR